MNEQIELPDGTLVGTGLIVPDERPSNVFASFPAVKELSDETIRDMLAKPGRTPRYERFGDDMTWSQGHIGSCAGYAACGATVRAMMLRGFQYVELAGEFTYSLCNGGRDVGSQLVDTMRSISTDGCARREFVEKYEYRKNRMRPEAFADAKNHIALEPYEVDEERQLVSGLAQGFVGVVAMHFGRNSANLDSNGIAGEVDGRGNHAVLVEDVTWIDGIGWVFDCRNSHGANYGRGGRMRLTWRKHFAQTNKYHVFYLLRTTKDVPYQMKPPTPQVT